MVAGALPARRAAPRALPGADAVPLRGGPADGDGGHLHLDGRQPALSLLRRGPARLGAAEPADRPAPGRADHVDPGRDDLPGRPLGRLLPLAGRGRHRRRGAPRGNGDPCRLGSPSPRSPRSSCS